MSIVRTVKEQKYFVASNALFNDKRLSWEARGIMGYLLSKPDGWQCHNYDLVNQGPAGEHTIKRIVKELREVGYVHRFKISKGRGKIEWITEVYESPELNPHFTTGDFSTVVNTTGDTIEVEKSDDIVSTDPQKVLNTKNTDSAGISKPSKTGCDHLNALADKIAKVAPTDIDTASPATRQQLKNLTVAISKKPDPDKFLAGYAEWWYANDWRGKKGQSPTVWTMGDTWGQFEAQANAAPVIRKGEKDNGIYI
jgi:hypothetical protein